MYRNIQLYRNTLQLLSDEELIYAYKKAVRNSLSMEFISLLKKEIENRGVKIRELQYT
ncbi:MAG: sporulation histidine kinase inhibitor Sda [Bacillus sp. (in: Bacteria)]|nr:sporulation histidine kinase inhibitor Sda [Bacillus sp. (in: firmicutes)]